MKDPQEKYDYQYMVHCEDHKDVFNESIVSQMKRRIKNHIYYGTDQSIKKDYLSTY